MKTLLGIAFLSATAAFAGGAHYPTNDSKKDDTGSSKDSGKDSSKEEAVLTCPNDSRFPIACESTDGLDILLCPDNKVKEDALMLVNGMVLHAKLDGNYAAYATYTAEASCIDMTYSLGLVNQKGQVASGFFSQTSQSKPFLSQSVDVTCALPF